MGKSMSVLNEEAITDTIGLLTGVFRCRRAPPPLELALGANEDKIEIPIQRHNYELDTRSDK